MTSITTESIRSMGVGKVIVLINKWLRLANLEGLTVDASVTPPVLKVIALPTVLEWVEQPYPNLSGATADFVITNPTCILGSLGVFRNGLRMMKEEDYTIGAMTVHFVLEQVPQIGDNVIVRYQVPVGV